MANWKTVARDCYIPGSVARDYASMGSVSRDFWAPIAPMPEHLQLTDDQVNAVLQWVAEQEQQAANEHRQKSRRGTETKQNKKQARMQRFYDAYQAHRQGNVSHTAAIDRAANDTGIGGRTAWDYAKELGLNPEK